MHLPGLDELRHAMEVVGQAMPPTPTYTWPLLNERTSTEVWVKHENHSPVGAFKIRGALVYMDALPQADSTVKGVVCATRGNFGQAVAFAAKRQALSCVIVVPFGNSVEKNRAMRALGAELVEHGQDFQAASEHAELLAKERGLHRVSSFNRVLVCGTATYAMEMLQSAPDLDVVYVAIGMGSAICGMMAARAALGYKTKIVGVVSAHAPAYALSFRQRDVISHAATTQMADGLACRTPSAEALELILHGVDRIIEVTDDEVAAAMLALYQDTHNVAEGAGAAGLAALMQDRDAVRGKRVGVVLSGGNVDAARFATVLTGQG